MMYFYKKCVIYRRYQLPKLGGFFKNVYDPFNPSEMLLKASQVKSGSNEKLYKRQQKHFKMLEDSRNYELYFSLNAYCVYASDVKDKCFVISDYQQWLL